MAMCPDAPYCIILLCLMPDDFIHQGKSAALNGLCKFLAMTCLT
jgi:hypothetical protein